MSEVLFTKTWITLAATVLVNGCNKCTREVASVIYNIQYEKCFLHTRIIVCTCHPFYKNKITIST